LQATLLFGERRTLTPEAVSAEEATAVRAAGVSEAALREAIYTGVPFNLIDRVGDALGLDIPASLAKGAARQLRRGYR
jgi:alkylhydroperoxidase family enzyme